MSYIAGQKRVSDHSHNPVVKDIFNIRENTDLFKLIIDFSAAC